MDDVAVMSKVAPKNGRYFRRWFSRKCWKLLDYLLRELPVLWAIARFLIINKVIILPIAFFVERLAIAVIIILVLGGLYLAYEGAEKYRILLSARTCKTRNFVGTDRRTNLAFEKKKNKIGYCHWFYPLCRNRNYALGTCHWQTHFITNNGRNYHCNHSNSGRLRHRMIVRMDETGLKLIKVNSNEGSLPIN
jgi:hypothetical protein